MKTLGDWARDYYDGVVDEPTYRKKRAEILDRVEEEPLVDMDATLPLSCRVPEADPAPLAKERFRPWMIWLLGALLLLALLAWYLLSGRAA